MMFIDLAKEDDEPIIDIDDSNAVAHCEELFKVLHFYRGYALINRSLHSESGVLKLFKSPEETDSEITYYLQGGHVQKSEKIVRDEKRPLACFEFKLQERGDTLLIIPEIGTSIDEVRNAFSHCSKLPLPEKEPVGSKIKSSVTSVLRVPWEATGLILGTLEELSESTKGATAKIFHEPTTRSPAKMPPTNVASGLLRGTGAVFQSVLSALAGIFVEPLRGAKKSGIKGAVVGLGKGMVELILKPVAGTLDLVTLTARGIANTPTTVYLKLNGVFKKRPVRRGPTSSSCKLQRIMPRIHMGDLEEEFDIEIDEKELKRQLIKEFAKKEVKRTTATEQISEELMNEIKEIQRMQLEALEKQRMKGYAYVEEELLKKVQEGLTAKNETKKEEDKSLEERDEFSGFPTLLGEAELDYFDEDLAGFDNIEEFNENEQNISILSQSIEVCEDFVTVKSEENSPEPKDESNKLSGFITPLAEEKNLSLINKQEGPRKGIKCHHSKNPLIHGSSIVEETKMAKREIHDENKADVSFKEEPVIQRKETVQEESKEIVVEKNRYRTREVIERAKALSYSRYKDEYRVPPADETGGLPLVDPKVLETLRGVAKEYLKQFFGRIFSGNFNLTTISFPIKCMRPISVLETFALGGALNPIYLNKAASIVSPLERFKYVIVAQIATFHATSNFLKPLNPILGETFNGEFEDGTRYYAEQTCHRPPISHFMFYGPEDLYTYTGYAQFAAHPSFNSITINVAGSRKLTFKDGMSIEFTNPTEFFDNAFVGTARHQNIGSITYKSPTHKIMCTLLFGKVKGKPQDYLTGEIKQEGRVVSKIYGSYLGFLEFDGIRYWDVRDIRVFPIYKTAEILPSDSEHRPDLQTLLTGDIESAQRRKEEMEEAQRKDARLRAETAKLRQPKKKGWF